MHHHMNGHIYLYTPNMVNFNLPFLSRLLPFFSYEYYIYNRYDWSQYPDGNASLAAERAFNQEGYKNATITGVKAHNSLASPIPEIFLSVPRFRRGMCVCARVHVCYERNNPVGTCSLFSPPTTLPPLHIYI